MARKPKKNITHVYTSTRVEYEKILFRVSNFFVLLSILFVDAHWTIDMPETVYLLLIGAILGVDVPALVRRFLKKV